MTENEDIAPDGADADDSAAEPHTVARQLLLKVGRSVPVGTDRLGTVQAREMTKAMANALLLRLPADDALSETEVARIFMGCTTGVPEAGRDSASDPLTEAQAGELTDGDVQIFAPFYLNRVLHRPPGDDPVRDIAAHARTQRHEYAEQLASLGKATQEQLRRMTGNAELMKNWGQLQSVLGGAFDSFQDEFKRITGPYGVLSDSMRAVLEINKSDTLHSMRDASKNDVFSALRREQKLKAAPAFATLPTMEAPRFPELLPISETPVGRTADAVERLAAAGERIERAVNAIVEQAGEVSDLIIGVSSTIQTESKTFQDQTTVSTKSALRYGRVSLVVAAAALVVSAVTGVWGFSADRADAKAQDQQSTQLLAKLRTQNLQMAALLTQQQQQPQEERERTGDQLRALEAMSHKTAPPPAPPTSLTNERQP